MFPVRFERHLLSSLPFPSGQGTKSIFDILFSIISERVVPYFKTRKGTDPTQLLRVSGNLAIHRLEDDENRIDLVGLLTRTDGIWSIEVHERIFDYLSFVTPVKPHFFLGDGSAEERRMLVFFELMLRHNIEHILYPEKKESEVIRSDVDFAMSWLEEDPTSYRMLREALSDDMNGIAGGGYNELFDHAEKGSSIDCAVARMVTELARTVSNLPDPFPEEVFPGLDGRLKVKVLAHCYQKSRNSGTPLVQRSVHFHRLLRLMANEIRSSRERGRHLFRGFKEKWGMAELLEEMGVQTSHWESREPDDLFEIFHERLQAILNKPKHSHALSSNRGARGAGGWARAGAASHPTPPKSLKERIEEARNRPDFPRQAIELIDKNRLNAAGQSGAKYAELIETLLSIPWGKIHPMEVSPSEFERGLNRTHFGLSSPKEIICDFFANLIWRYQHFREEDAPSWKRTGSVLLLVGPPGVGKTSLAVSIARSLGIPYHKISLGGMRDEADIRGYGFTYEGSKPGPIVQGLVKMGAMNGMFIFDEADKTEKFAIATLLEILDPEQNHLFHDKYTQSTVDIDLSNSHFILTANTLETVPPPVVDRCEVIFLGRYSVEEKIAIAREYLVRRVRDRYMISEEDIFFDPYEEEDLLRYLVTNHTYEAGVRDLERIIRTLFLRVHRKEILGKGMGTVRLTAEKIREYLDRHQDHTRSAAIEDERLGELKAFVRRGGMHLPSSKEWDSGKRAS